MTYWQTTAFKDLQEAWYERLAADGFRDVERLVGSEMLLDSERRLPEDTREITEHYYQIIASKIHEAEFRNDIDRLVLTSYCEGKKIQTICEELRTLCKPPCFRLPRRSRHTIRFIVRRYEALWGLREWTPQQLGRKVG